MTCLIWGTPAQEEPKSGDARVIISERAGGSYRAVGSVEPQLAALDDWTKARLTTWLVDQRRSGVASPLISPIVLEEVAARRPLRVGERKERFFRAVIDAGLGVDGTIFLGAVTPEKRFWHMHLSAWTESRSFKETVSLAHLLAQDGLLVAQASPLGLFLVSSAGWRYVDELDASGGDTKQVFVAMWFGDEMNDAWRLGIAPGLRDAGYLPLRIDNKQHNGKIDDEIVAEIKRSKFLVADFTCGAVEAATGVHAVPRGGVYYEAGFAHGLGKDVIFCCHRDRIGDVHFDTRQFAHLVWGDAEELRALLYNRVVATIGEAPNAPGRGMSEIGTSGNAPRAGDPGWKTDPGAVS